jgi:hypothetical protein
MLVYGEQIMIWKEPVVFGATFIWMLEIRSITLHRVNLYGIGEIGLQMHVSYEYCLLWRTEDPTRSKEI